MRQGVHAAVAVPEIRVATAVDSIAGRVTDVPVIDIHADLGGRHVDGHVTHVVRVRWTHPNTFNRTSIQYDCASVCMCVCVNRLYAQSAFKATTERFTLSKYVSKNNNKYVRLRGRRYIHTCRSYAHMPRDIDRHAITQALPALNFTSWWVTDSSDFGLLGEQNSPKWDIPCPGRRWTTVQNLTPLALSLPEKSVTVQTKTIKITNSNR